MHASCVYLTGMGRENKFPWGLVSPARLLLGKHFCLDRTSPPLERSNSTCKSCSLTAGFGKNVKQGFLSGCTCKGTVLLPHGVNAKIEVDSKDGFRLPSRSGGCCLPVFTNGIFPGANLTFCMCSTLKSITNSDVQ